SRAGKVTEPWQLSEPIGPPTRHHHEAPYAEQQPDPDRRPAPPCHQSDQHECQRNLSKVKVGLHLIAAFVPESQMTGLITRIVPTREDHLQKVPPRYLAVAEVMQRSAR